MILFETVMNKISIIQPINSHIEINMISLYVIRLLYKIIFFSPHCWILQQICRLMLTDDLITDSKFKFK